MKNLYDRIHERTQVLKEDFDFAEGMNSLFSNSFQSVRDFSPLPVEAETSDWQEDSSFNRTALVRTFTFDSYKHLMFFVSETLKESDKMNHHPSLIIKESSVEVELYTLDINDVSEQDLNLAKFIDEIYDDVRFIQEF